MRRGWRGHVGGGRYIGARNRLRLASGLQRGFREAFDKFATEADLYAEKRAAELNARARPRAVWIAFSVSVDLGKIIPFGGGLDGRQVRRSCGRRFGFR